MCQKERKQCRVACLVSVVPSAAGRRVCGDPEGPPSTGSALAAAWSGCSSAITDTHNLSTISRSCQRLQSRVSAHNRITDRSVYLNCDQQVSCWEKKNEWRAFFFFFLTWPAEVSLWFVFCVPVLLYWALSIFLKPLVLSFRRQKLDRRWALHGHDSSSSSSSSFSSSSSSLMMKLSLRFATNDKRRETEWRANVDASADRRLIGIYRSDGWCRLKFVSSSQHRRRPHWHVVWFLSLVNWRWSSRKWRNTGR